MKEHAAETRGQQPVQETALLLQGDSWELPSTRAAIESAAGEFRKRLARIRVTKDQAIDLEVGFREALSNAVVHGNKEIESLPEDTLADVLKSSDGLGADRHVYVALAISKSEVRVTVRDEGAGFDVSAVPNPLEKENREKASGRGLFLMRTFYDSVTYNDEGTEVTLTKRLENK